MANSREEDLPLNKMVPRVAMYATEGAKFHKYGEKTMVDPTMVAHFEARGYSKIKPADKPADDAEKGDEEV